ncbi:MAG: 4-(cytidine 5'-diphospho)-2-C-methyl-D-erythritol kinase, partial [Candidatus Margulisbacteria bacterium]|nr:4-(cytidine 5'-diphospho)-2-C-methyl-D-erythritol kinase [Candidatus Margulisiibacteriota bacterium]
MKLKAFAKVNLSLRVFERRSDGYHSIESIMQSISLCDYITIEPISTGIEITCDDPAVPLGKENIVYKAVEVFFDQRLTTNPALRDPETHLNMTIRNRDDRRPARPGWRIHIEKHIPIAAGLAGGSADAAAVLYGLRQMTNDKSCLPAGRCQITNDELVQLSSQIGSDVPFCLMGGTCLVKGRGEIVTKLDPWPHTYFVLVNPGIEISTQWAYAEFDRLHLTVSRQIKNVKTTIVYFPIW